MAVTAHPIPTPSADADLRELVRLATGRVTLPSDPGWDRSRRAWNLAVDQHPAAVVEAADAADVATVVRHAARTERRLALQRTGHGAASLQSLRDMVLVRTSALTEIAVDAQRHRARVGAGVLAHELGAAAGAHGLTFLAGSAPDVGVTGYTLGGGVGWLARRYGLACNRVVAADVVTADGEARRIHHEADPELFWALRGGGGSFAAVTALELELVPVAQVYAGSLLWPIERAAEVVRTWRDWTAQLPDTVTSIARLLRFPSSSAVPGPLRGRQLVSVEAAFLDDVEAADVWLRPLRALRAESETFGPRSTLALGELHGDPRDPAPTLTETRLLHALSDATLDAILSSTGPGTACPLAAVDLRHLGGALSRSLPVHGVLDRLEAGYAMYAMGVPSTAERAGAVGASLTALREATAPWDAGSQYLNLADRPVDPTRLFGPERSERLRAVKGAYDPSDRFVSNHPIPPPV